MGRPPITDVHTAYMVTDLDIRASVFSIGYPMSNTARDFSSTTTGAPFIDGPGIRYETLSHELGHSVRLSQFDGETEALVNFLHVMGMNYGLGQDLNEATKASHRPHTYDLDKTATHRLITDTFGSERIIANRETNELRYQPWGYGHYSEIVNLFGWCALKDFWYQENVDFEENGTVPQGHKIDRRILKMSIAAKVDLRPLFHFFGILPKDPITLQESIVANELPSSLA